LKADRAKQLSILQASLDAQYSRLKSLNLQLRDMLKEQDVSQKMHRPVPAGLQHNILVIQQEQKGLGCSLPPSRLNSTACVRKCRKTLHATKRSPVAGSK
jgi:hypothetical protein